MSALLSSLIDRMKEPSTWIGLGSLVTAIGWKVAPDLWQAISVVGMGIGGLIAILLPERKA